MPITYTHPYLHLSSSKPHFHTPFNTLNSPSLPIDNFILFKSLYKPNTHIHIPHSPDSLL